MEKRLWTECSMLSGNDKDYQKEYEKCEDCPKYRRCLKYRQEFNKKVKTFETRNSFESLIRG